MTECKLLTIDDDQNITEFVSCLASDAGFLTESVSGQDLHQVYKQFNPDVVVLDIHMPGRDGFAAIQYLAEHKSRPRIIVLSGSNDAYYQPLRQLAQGFGFELNNFIAKPFDPIALQDFLNSLHGSLSAKQVH